MADDKVLLMVSGGPDSATLAKEVKASVAAGTKIHGIYLRSGHASDDQEIMSADTILKQVGGLAVSEAALPRSTPLRCAAAVLATQFRLYPEIKERRVSGSDRGGGNDRLWVEGVRRL